MTVNHDVVSSSLTGAANKLLNLRIQQLFSFPDDIAGTKRDGRKTVSFIHLFDRIQERIDCVIFSRPGSDQSDTGLVLADLLLDLKSKLFLQLRYHLIGEDGEDLVGGGMNEQLITGCFNAVLQSCSKGVGVAGDSEPEILIKE